MKIYFLITLIVLGAITTEAQTDIAKDIFAFRITDYSVTLNDSIILVQVEINQGNAGIQEGQVGLLKGNSGTGDTSAIGSGKCNLIKGSYYYFGIHLADKKRLPKKGDVIYTFGNYPATFKGQVYKLIQHDIYLQHITGGGFYTFAFPVFGDKDQEKAIIDALVADIKYTGKEMLQQNDGQDRLITSGRFKDKKLFAAMQSVTNNDVSDFLNYVIYRTSMYAGNDWKIAEIFATWMDGGTPTVIENK
ncbi:MAG: hypothetical protein ABI685_08660 [Ferruginibacter sp.]